MKSANSMSDKGNTLLWVLIFILVLGAGAFALYVRLGLQRPAPVSKPAVVRGKISSVSPQTPMPAPAVVKVPADPQMAPTEPVHPAEETAGDLDESKPQHFNIASDDPHEGIVPIAFENSSPAPASPNSVADHAAPKQPEEPDGADKQPPVSSLSSVGETATATENQRQDDSPSAAPKTLARPDDSEPPMPFTIQFGAYLTKAYADEAVSRLTAKGYDAYIHQRPGKKERVWHMVRFGHFPSREKAAAALQMFKEREHLDAAIALANVEQR